MLIPPESWLQVNYFNRAIATVTNQMLLKKNKDKLDTLRKIREHWEEERNNLLVSIYENNTREEEEVY